MPSNLSRRELVRKFRSLGYLGPFSGKRHQFMLKGMKKIRIPNPHGSGEINVSPVKEMRSPPPRSHLSMQTGLISRTNPQTKNAMELSRIEVLEKQIKKFKIKLKIHKNCISKLTIIALLCKTIHELRISKSF